MTKPNPIGKLLALVLLFLLPLLTSTAQQYQKQYSQPFAGVKMVASKLLSDHNLLLIGTLSPSPLHEQLLVSKLNTTNGDTIWSKTYTLTGRYSVGIACEELTNGHLIIGANTADTVTSHDFPSVMLLCLTDSGTMVWSKTYNYWGAYQSNHLNILKALPGNSFLACIQSFDTLAMSILKLDANGDTLFTRSILVDSIGSYWNMNVTDAAVVKDGYLFTGTSSFDGRSSSLIVFKTDTLGHPLWLKSDFINFRTLFLNVSGIKIQPLSDTEVVLWMSNFSTQILKMNSDGYPKWLKSIQDSPTLSDVIFHNVTRLSDGNFAFTGITDFSRNSYTNEMAGKQFIIKTDTAGNIIWSKKYLAHTNNNIADFIAELPGGDLLTCGRMFDSTAIIAGKKPKSYLMRLDTAGVSSGLPCGADSSKRAAVINQPIAFADKAYHTSYAHELIPLAVAENAAPLEINDVGRATFCNLSFSPSILCEGSTATFTAVATNGGSHPTFRFIVNGHTVQYGSSPTYATASLRLNDTVVCMMHSTDSCAAPDSIASNTILAPIWPTASPSVTITVSPGDTILAGTRVYFTATVTNGGPSPFYDWRKNGISTGFNRSTYTSTTLTNGDVVTCYVNTSVCAAPSFAISNADTIVIIDAGVTAIPLLANSLYPNPTTGNCTLTLPGAQSGQLVVTNVLGETFVNRPVSGTETIIYTGSWPTGSYLVRLRTATGSWYTSLQVMR